MITWLQPGGPKVREFRGPQVQKYGALFRTRVFPTQQSKNQNRSASPEIGSASLNLDFLFGLTALSNFSDWQIFGLADLKMLDLIQNFLRGFNKSKKKSMNKETEWFNLSMISCKMPLIGDEKANCFAQPDVTGF